MVKRRYSRADIGNALQVDVGKPDTMLLTHVEQDLAPRFDHEAVSEGAAPVLMAPDLSCGYPRDSSVPAVPGGHS